MRVRKQDAPITHPEPVCAGTALVWLDVTLRQFLNAVLTKRTIVSILQETTFSLEAHYDDEGKNRGDRPGPLLPAGLRRRLRAGHRAGRRHPAAVPGVVEEVAGGALDEVLEGVQPRTPEGGDVVPGAEGEGVLLVVALRLPEAVPGGGLERAEGPRPCGLQHGHPGQRPLRWADGVLEQPP